MEVWEESVGPREDLERVRRHTRRTQSSLGALSVSREELGGSPVGPGGVRSPCRWSGNGW